MSALSVFELREYLISEFERCRPWIEAALAHSGGTHLAEDVFSEILRGKLVFWPAPECCMVTEIELYPRKRHCHIFLAAGHLPALKRLLPAVEQYARDIGCDAMTVRGRRGWARVGLPWGYEEKWTTMIHDLRKGAPE